jgi:hypothetical protein
MAFSAHYLAEHPPPTGMLQALGVAGFRLLFEVAGVGVGRQGSDVFLVVAADPAPGGGEPGPTDTHVVGHQARFRDEAELNAWLELAAQLGLLRLGGWQLVLTRQGLRSSLEVLNPQTGAVTATIPDRLGGLGGRLMGRRQDPRSLVAGLRGLQPPEALAGPERSREQLYGLYLSLAMQDPDVLGSDQAIAIADRAFELAEADPSLDPRQALAAARSGGALPSGG